MKCPKCGNEVKEKRDWVGVKYDISEDCEYCCNKERLDKVLSKFDKMNNDLYWALRWHDDFIDYMVGTDEFKFRGYTISLETVESLINDLEVQNDTK